MLSVEHRVVNDVMRTELDHFFGNKSIDICEIKVIA